MRKSVAPLIAASLVLLATVVGAQPVAIGDLLITGAWARASVVQNGAAYVTIENRGAEADRLIAIESDAAAAPQLHEHSTDGGIMRMRPVPGGIEIPPGGKVRLQPGGYHMMLMGLERRLIEGENLTVTLRFERAGAVAIEVPILAPGSSGPPQTESHGAGDGP